MMYYTAQFDWAINIYLYRPSIICQLIIIEKSIAQYKISQSACSSFFSYMDLFPSQAVYHCCLYQEPYLCQQLCC